jgi:hypothetical protein
MRLSSDISMAIFACALSVLLLVTMPYNLGAQQASFSSSSVTYLATYPSRLVRDSC